ncbi:MAG: leucine-rich repeat protein [Bacilli bacterium]|nr:leucine-rich repeat protein [Bacilli bacterium]
MNKIKHICFIVLSFLLAACEKTILFTNEDESLIVALHESDNFVIQSENPLSIKRGDDAIFYVKLNEGVSFDDSSIGKFNPENGQYIVENIQMSQNVVFKTKVAGNCTLTIKNTFWSRGEVTVTPNKEKYDVGEMVTIETKQKTDIPFLCYTKSYPYRCVDTTMPSGLPISFNSKFEFAIESDMTIYVNYFENSAPKITYNMNGGEPLVGNDEQFVLDYDIPEQFKSPTTLLGTKFMKRDGFTLESYNTNKDGTGIRVGIGSSVNINLFRNNEIVLYANWKKWSDDNLFELNRNEDGTCSIKKYLGNEDEIVLPDYIDGMMVTKINKEAFDSINCKSIILNLHLNEIADSAFINCLKLEEILFFTSVTSMTPSFILNCPNFKTLKINNTLYNYDMTHRNGDIIGQIQTLENEDKNKIILFGPSTTRYNQPISPFKENFPTKFTYLAGMTGSCNYKLALEIVLSTLNENDYILPQLYERSLKLDAGGTETLTFFNYDFDILQKINISEYIENIFTIFPLYVSDYLENQSDKIYLNDKFGAYDETGMHYWGPETDDPNNKDSSTYFYFKPYQEEKNFSYILELTDKYGIPRNHVLPTWSSYNKNSVTSLDYFEEYQNFAKSCLPFQFFDTIQDNIYKGELFRLNDSIHLSITGGLQRAKNWSAKLLNYIR